MCINKSSEHTILIIETALTGHRGLYLKWIIESFLEDDFKVIAAIPIEYADHLSIYGLENKNLEFQLYDIHVSFIDSRLHKLGLLGRDIYHYFKYKNLYRRSSSHSYIEFVFVPFVDQILYSIAVFGSPFGRSRFSGISMRPDFHYRKFGISVPDKRASLVKELIFRKFIRTSKLNCLLTLDEPLYLYCKNSCEGKINYLPDPIKQIKTDEHRFIKLTRKLGLDANKRQILVFGSLTGRKGIIELIESSIGMADAYNLQFVFAGKLDIKMHDYFSLNTIKQFIKDKKIVLIDRFVSEEEESALFSNAYICWLGYINHYQTSGVLITAAKYEVPVIATDQGVIAWQVKRYRLGLCVNVSEVEQVNSAITRFFSDSSFHDYCAQNANKAFVSNTLENAKKIVVNSMESKY